jgi:hypothetical protein
VFVTVKNKGSKVITISSTAATLEPVGISKLKKCPDIASGPESVNVLLTSRRLAACAVV